MRQFLKTTILELAVVQKVPVSFAVFSLLSEQCE